jgi:type II secretory pathway component PulF
MIRLDQEMWQSPGLLLAMGILFLIYLALSFGGLYLIYLLLTLPLRRAERARLFLDLLELGASQGVAPEQMITQVSATGDNTFGRGFHRLAREVASGKSLGAALHAMPHVMSPEISAMLAIGERVGEVKKVIPAARRLLSDALSQTRGALNYLLVVTFAFTPVMIVPPIVLQVLVLPKFKEIFAGMFEASRLPAFTRFVFGSQQWFVAIQVGFLLLLWLAVVAYAGGPRLRGWLRGFAPDLVDRFLCALPWRRKRLQRDFSAMLSVLLDAGLPEEEAVKLAGEATQNRVFIKRATVVRDQLRAGVTLPEAIQAIDHAGELRWRLTNALKRGGDFQRILAGWLDALDARAFQQEQAAAQVATTALVLYNGLVVGMVVIAMFLGLISLIYTATLW